MFSERAKTIALAIVKIFETSKPFGDYSAVAVLDDGAGISYGTSQFTHKSGSLYAVLKRFEKLGGDLPRIVDFAMPDFEVEINITRLGNHKALKKALAELGDDPLMQLAQREIAFENYLEPALDACEGSNFVCALSLAVIYDSMNHGSYGKIRDRVELELPASIKPEEYEREWITAYVKKRHAWLTGTARLKKTAYRTQFFLDQIKRLNWNLTLPLDVHGFKLTDAILFPGGSAHPVNSSAAAPQNPGALPNSATFDDHASAAISGSQSTAADAHAHDTTAEDLEAMQAGKTADLASGAAPGATPSNNQLSPQLLDKERPSTFARVITWIFTLVGGVVASITATCGGNEVANLVVKRGAEKVVEGADRSDLASFGLVLGLILAGLVFALLVFAAGAWIYDRSAERANKLNLKKADLAGSQDHNTVEFKKTGSEVKTTNEVIE